MQPIWWSSSLSEFVNTGDDSSIVTLCSVSLKNYLYFMYKKFFCDEFTYQKNSVNKKTNPEKKNSTITQGFMGLSGESNAELPHCKEISSTHHRATNVQTSTQRTLTKVCIAGGAHSPNCPFPGPPNTWLFWAHPNPRRKRHLNRPSHFNTAHGYVQQKHTQTDRATSIAIRRIFAA